ncbi:hypothetical protein VPHD530_0005 [Vibrio phage D530]
MALTNLTKPRARWTAFKLKVAKSVSRSLYEKLLDRVTVKDFGAKGDGITDDYEAIQACADFVYTDTSLGVKGGVIRLPEGIYTISRPIVVTSGHVVKGAGSMSTNMRKPTNGTTGLAPVLAANSTAMDVMDVDAFFVVTHLSSTYAHNFEIEGLRLLGSKTEIGQPSAGHTPYGIYMPRGQTCTIRDVQTHRCQYSFFTHDTWMLDATAFQAQYCGSLFKYKHDGVSKIGCGTSLTATRCWASSPLTEESFYYPAFDFEKVGYSTMNSCGADGYYAPYKFVDSEFTLNSCGNEIARSNLAIQIKNSILTINGHSFVSPSHTGAQTAQVWIEDGSKVVLNNPRFSNQIDGAIGEDYCILAKGGSQVVVTNPTWNTSGSRYTVKDTATMTRVEDGQVYTSFTDSSTGDKVELNSGMHYIPTRSTSQLANRSHSINTEGKYKGKQVWSGADNKPVFASGGSDNDSWLNADGSVNTTPA